MISAKDIEKSINHALALKEKGVAVPTILAVFPEERKYIEAALDFIGTLKTKKEELSPSQDALAHLLEEITANVKKESSQVEIEHYASKPGSFLGRLKKKFGNS